MGQPISIGSREWNWGSISLDEVSIVRQGAVKGYAPPAVIGVDAFEPADVDRAVVVTQTGIRPGFRRSASNVDSSNVVRAGVPLTVGTCTGTPIGTSFAK